MREILFRGKRVDNGEWVEGSLLKGKKGDADCAIIVPEKELQTIGLDFCGECNRPYDKSFEVFPETIGQYIGKEDTNGKKIFEGDIIKIDSSCYDDTYTTKVFDYNGTLCVDIWHREYDQTAIAFAFDDWDTTGDEVEVIGNIHDNPELLEEVKQ